MLDAVEQTAIWTREKIAAICDLIEQTMNYIREQLPSIYSRELVELLFVQPYCRIGHMVDGGIVKRQTASRYLQKLCHICVLREVKFGREKLFVHPKLMHLLLEDNNKVVAYAGR